MTNGVGGTGKDLGILLQKRKAQLESLNAQKKAVTDKLDGMIGEQAKAQEGVNAKTKTFTEAFTQLQNHPMKGKSAPKQDDYKKDNPDYVQDAEGNYPEGVEAKIDDTASFEAAMKEFEEMEKLQAIVDKLAGELDIDKAELEQLGTAVAEAEAEQMKKGEEYDFTAGSIDDLTKQIEEFELKATINTKEGDQGISWAIRDELEDAENADGDDMSAGEKYSNAQTKAFGQSIADADGKKDAYDKFYTSMKNGDSSTYTYEEAKDMAASLGYDLSMEEFSEFNVDATYDEMGLDEEPAPSPTPTVSTTPNTPPAEDEDPNAKYKAGNNGEITLPRGIDYKDKDGNEMEPSLDMHNIKDNGDGTYSYITPPKGQEDRTFTADEVNEYFRGIEENAGLNPRLLDKAEKAGVDIDAISDGVESGKGKDVNKALKEAINFENAKDDAIKDHPELAEEPYKSKFDDCKTDDDVKALVKELKADKKEDKKEAKAAAKEKDAFDDAVKEAQKKGVNVEGLTTSQQVEDAIDLHDAKASAAKKYPNLDTSNCKTEAEVEKAVDDYKAAAKKAEKLNIDISGCKSAADINTKIEAKNKETAELDFAKAKTAAAEKYPDLDLSKCKTAADVEAAVEKHEADLDAKTKFDNAVKKAKADYPNIDLSNCTTADQVKDAVNAYKPEAKALDEARAFCDQYGIAYADTDDSKAVMAKINSYIQGLNSTFGNNSSVKEAESDMKNISRDRMDAQRDANEVGFNFDETETDGSKIRRATAQFLGAKEAALQSCPGINLDNCHTVDEIKTAVQKYNQEKAAKDAPANDGGEVWGKNGPIDFGEDNEFDPMDYLK